MQKEQVLVHDSKGIFLKMFRRKLKNHFEFSERPFSIEIGKEIQNFDRIVYVLYDKQEALDFLKQENNEANFLVCLFNKQLYKSLSFLEWVNNLILLDESKTRCEIFKEVNLFFKKKSETQKINKPIKVSNTSQANVNAYYKAMYFLM